METTMEAKAYNLSARWTPGLLYRRAIFLFYIGFNRNVAANNKRQQDYPVPLN